METTSKPEKITLYRSGMNADQLKTFLDQSGKDPTLFTNPSSHYSRDRAGQRFRLTGNFVRADGVFETKDDALFVGLKFSLTPYIKTFGFFLIILLFLGSKDTFFSKGFTNPSDPGNSYGTYLMAIVAFLIAVGIMAGATYILKRSLRRKLEQDLGLVRVR